MAGPRSSGGGNTQNVSPSKTTTKTNTSGYSGAQYAAMSKKTATPAPKGLTPAEIQHIKNVGAARMPSTVVPPDPTPDPNVDPNADSYVDPGTAGTPAVVAPSGADLAKLGENDTAYQLRMQNLNDALAAYTADQAAQKTRYNTSYKDSLKSLGWDFAPSMDIADTAEVPTMDKLITLGKWNEGDRTTAAGRGISNQLEDFASRGMTDSSFFARAKNDLMKSLNDQLYSTINARKSFSDDLASQLKAYNVEKKANEQAALDEAKNRVLSQWALNNA